MKDLNLEGVVKYEQILLLLLIRSVWGSQAPRCEGGA